jgi:hypothetical protein
MKEVKKLKTGRFFAGVMFLISLLMSLTILAGQIEIGVLGILLFIISGFYLESARKKLKSLCYKCGSSMKGCSYEYVELNRTEGQNGNISSKVEFRATCPQCNVVKTIKESFLVYDSGYSKQADGSWKQTKSPKVYNLQDNVEKLAKKYFGH